MDIIFDRQRVRMYGDPEDKENTPDKIEERREAQLKVLGEFMGAESVQYDGEGKGEEYIITKGDKKLILLINGNAYDGGWMNVEIKDA